MIVVVDRGGCRTIGSSLEKDMDSGFWGFEKEREEHCIAIPRIMKAEGFRGVALGHRDASHGGGLREEPKSRSTLFRFRHFEERGLGERSYTEVPKTEIR
jgi:hypothetical protein